MSDWDDWFQCMSCPGAWFRDRDAYAEHVKTKWHQYNSNCKMMGGTCLSEADYNAKFGVKIVSEPPKEEQKLPPAAAAVEEVKEDSASVLVMFAYQGEKWSHRFSVKKGSTIWDLKRSMVKHESPEEDLLCFSLKQGMIRVWNFETIESDETFDFHYIGPEEGQRFLDRDRQRKQRDEDEARERESEEERKKLEKERQEREREYALRREEEDRRKAEEEEARRQEEEKRWWEEEERRKRDEAQRWWEEEERRKREEAEHTQREEEERARLEEERLRQEEEERLRREEERRAEERRQEEERVKREADEERHRQEEQARQEEEQRLASAAPIDVLVHIDRALEFQVPLSLPCGSRISEVKQRLASDDPTGQLRPEDIELLDETGREMGDEERLLQSAELELKGSIAI